MALSGPARSGAPRARRRASTAAELWALLRRNADFRRLFLAAVVSLAGDWFAFVAVSGLVTELTGSEGLAAVVYAANVLPIFVAAPLAGVLADRVDRKRLMITVDLLRVLPALGLLAALVLGQAWVALVCMVLLGFLAAFFDPVVTAAAPNLVDPDDLPLAQAALGSVWGTMLFVGAALGGLLAAGFGREVTFVVNAATFVVSAVLLWRIRRPFRVGPLPVEASLVSNLRELGSFVRRRKVTRALLVTKAGVGIGNGLVGLLPAYAIARFGAGDRGVGLLLAARGLGALVGPLLARRVVGANGRRLLLVAGLSMIAYAVAYLFLPLAASLAAAAVCVALAHAGGGAQWVLSTYGLQMTTPDAVRGRVMSLDFGLATLAIGVSSLAAGGAAELVGVAATSWALVAVSFVYGCAWLVWTRELWRGPGDPLTLVDEPAVPAMPAAGARAPGGP